MTPVCSFCGGRRVIAWLEGPRFQIVRGSPDEVRADEAWLACSTCLHLVETGDRDGLVRRGVARAQRRGNDSPETVATQVREHFDATFWIPRSGS